MPADAWTLGELQRDLVRFEEELRAADLQETTIRTYVDRSSIFVRWLAGESQSVGPNALASADR